jgi:multidrug resistance efflux pump
MSTPRKVELEIANATLQARIVRLGADNAALQAQVEKLERTDLTRIAENYALRAELEWWAVHSIRATAWEISTHYVAAREMLKSTHDPR